MDDIYRVPVGDDDRARAGLATRMVALATGIPVAAIEARERQSRPARRARWLSMYVSHVGYGWPLERVGHAFGFNRNTVSTACRWVEEARERGPVDRSLIEMEGIIRALAALPKLELQS